MMTFSVLFCIAAPIVLAAAVSVAARRNTMRLDVLTIASCALELIAAAVIFTVTFTEGSQKVFARELCAFGLTFETGGFHSLYLLVTAFAWFVSSVFTADYMKHGEHRTRYAFFLLLTLSGTVGVFLSADLYTTLVFFEVMSFASYAWVAHEETEAARGAAETYLFIAVVSGLSALMGIWLINDLLGTLVIDELPEALARTEEAARFSARFGAVEALRSRELAAAVCLLIGFGAKAGMFPLHIWLPKAHAAAPATASSLLSGILTKAGVYGIIILTCRIMAGDRNWGLMLLVIGVLTMMVGGILALFDNNIKRTLACSSVSQIGFILTGCAVLTLDPASELAAGGVVLHMLNHSLCKLVLFTAAGVAYMNAHTLELEKLRGWGRGKPAFFAAFALGFWGITGLPGGSGYISKTLLHESIVELAEHAANPAFFSVCEWLFLLSGGLTLAYMTKLAVVLFAEKPASQQTKAPYMARSTASVLLFTALLIPILGLFPGFTADRLAEFSMPFFRLGGFEGAAYFSLESLKGAAITLTIGMLVYFSVVRTLSMRKDGLVRRYINARPAWLDLERYGYRPLLSLLAAVFGGFAALLDRMADSVFSFLAKLGGLLARFADSAFDRLFVFLRMLGGVIARFADSLIDAILALLRLTVYRDTVKRLPPQFGNRATYAVGSFLDGIADSYCAVAHKERKGKPYIYRVSKFFVITTRQNQMITRTMGYAMLMTCIGIIVTLLYILRKLI